MTNLSLAEEYLKRVKSRLKAIEVLNTERDFPDVIRECQEAVELMLKAALRRIGIDPPKWHDVGPIIRLHAASFEKHISPSDLERLCTLSQKLRKERELSFYGDNDFLPLESYSEAEANQFFSDTKWLYGVVTKIVP